MSDNTAVINKIKEVIAPDRVHEAEIMSSHTSFRIGGPCDAFVEVINPEELATVLKIVCKNKTEHMLIGNGTNLLVSDEGYPGIMIKLSGGFEAITQSIADDTQVTAGGAKLLSSLSAYLTEHGLSGFEFASGIPGTVGGAMFMNAGAYGGEMNDIVTSVRLMTADGSKIFERTGEEMDFSYRHSSIQADGSIVLSATFKLQHDDKAAIAARVAELQEKRNSKQPVNFPSAGSTFKRPVGGYAAALIDEAGLRGTAVGGAQVSEKHAGFVINSGGATCENVLELMRHVQKEVFMMSGITLEPEVRLINCEL